MPSKVFISYSHQQGTWVWDRLVPVLKAGGVEVLIDRERFTAGRALLGQMDATQASADVNVLVFSPDYVASAPVSTRWSAPSLAIRSSRTASSCR
jgi:hypothetical protein